MSIPLSQQIPEVWDIQDEKLRDIVIQLKLCIEEIARKGQATQSEVRTSAPSASEIDENEFVRATVGGLNYIYTKKEGTVLRWQIT